jgi:hypothetical protein
MKFLQVKKPWHILDSIEDFRTYTGRQTVDAYYMYYLTKLFKQQYNVNNRYIKQLQYLFFKKIYRNNFRGNLQLQPYQITMYPYYQALKGVYLKDTIFHVQYSNQSSYNGLVVLKKNFNSKLLKNTKFFKNESLFYGGLNYIFRPKVYKYGIQPRINNLSENLNALFKGTASFKNITWLDQNKYKYLHLNNFFFF